MQSYRIETTVSEQGTLVIQDVPFPPGDHVEVVVREVENSPDGQAKYALRGTPYEYRQPFDSVAEAEWGAGQ
ncbi:MAG: hypothetical protein IT426_17505 [Pirellulales bacterium]|nr:hypothetical protein [Pirellulales bacterium]